VLTNQIDFGLNVQEAGDACAGNMKATTTNRRKNNEHGGFVNMESGRPYETVRELCSAATMCASISGATAVTRPSKSKCMMASAFYVGASESRKTEWRQDTKTGAKARRLLNQCRPMSRNLLFLATLLFAGAASLRATENVISVTTVPLPPAPVDV